MKFVVIENEGNRYFYSIDQAAMILGISRRAIFDLLKKVRIEPQDKRQEKQKSLYSEEVLGRLWAVHQRIGRASKGVQTAVASKPSPEKGGSEQRPPAPISKTQTVEQKQAVEKWMAEMLAKL